MKLADFIYLFGAEALRVVSNEKAIIPFRTGRSSCQCLTTRPFSACTSPPSFPNSMPEAEMTIEQLKNIMETQMGFTENEWQCLTGAHSLGRAQRSFSGYGGSWTATPATFDHSYWRNMMTENWIAEDGVVSTDENIPAVGKRQFRHDGSNRMMLRSDMAPYWNIEETSTERAGCPVLHGPGCSPSARLNFARSLSLSVDTFFDCFNPAFQKMSELGNSGLVTPS